MRADPKPTPAELEGANAWLEGLAGRSGHGSEHDDGATLRQALQPVESESPPSWADIERRAGLAPTSRATSSTSGTGDLQRVAANAPRWLPWLGAAAAVLLVIGVGAFVFPPEPVEGLRGGSSVGQGPTVIWRVAHPVRASKELAEELQLLGASVEWRADDNGARLNISASGEMAVAAVNRRLAEIETALDSSGRLTLSVTGP